MLQLSPDLYLRFATELDDVTMQHFATNNASTLKANIGHYIAQREPTQEMHADLYVSGFPCRPFSQPGLQLGENAQWEGAQRLKASYDMRVKGFGK